MAGKEDRGIRSADGNTTTWKEHPRVKGSLLKPLLAAAENPLANLNLVQGPVGGVVPRHIHAKEVETVCILSGQAILVLGEEERPFGAGQTVAIPMGLEHRLINQGDVPIEMFTFFTPPLQ